MCDSKLTGLIAVILTWYPVFSRKINIIQFMLGDGPVLGYASQGPALDVAFDQAVIAYSEAMRDVTRTIVYKPGNFSCPDSAALMPVVAAETDALIRKMSGFTVVINTGCSLETMVLGDFAREWNVPLIGTIGMDPLLANRKRYPAMVVFAWDNVIKMRAVLAFLDYFRWGTLAMICDTLSDLPGNAVNLASACRSLTALVTANKQRFQLYQQNIDSKAGRASDVAYRKALLSASLQSRVIVLISIPARTRNIMVVAHLLNMTNGDYIYLTIVQTQVPDQGNLTWRADDADDEAAKSAFQSLIFINYPNPDWTRIGDILEGIANRSVTSYGVTLNSDTLRNDMAIEAYETMTSLAMMIDETHFVQPGADTNSFYQRFLNRTFDLKSRSVTIGSNGVKLSDMVMSRLNLNTDEVEETWRYVSSIGVLKPVSSSASVWRNGIGPPPDNPKCGFRNDLCFQNSLTTPLALAMYALLGGFVIISVTLMSWKVHYDAHIAASTWWILEERRLVTWSAKKVAQSSYIRSVLRGSLYAVGGTVLIT